MASRQEKEQKAEAEARQAASDLSDVNRDTEWEWRAWTEHVPEERPGVIGSVMKAVQSAKEAVVGKSRDEHGRRDEDADYFAGEDGGDDRDRSKETTMRAKKTTESAAGTLDDKAREAAERAREAKERAKERTGEMTEKAKEVAGEIKDYTAKKASEAAERTKQMAESAKEKTKETAESAKGKTKETAQSTADKTKEKAQEAKEKTEETAQLAADKTKETTQSAASKLGELKDKAMGLFSGKKEEAKEQTYEITETDKEKLRETEEETQQRMEELRLKGRDEYKGNVARRVREDKDESERGREDKGGGILGALKEKLTLHPSDMDKSRLVDESRVAGRNEAEKREPRTGEEKAVEVHVEETVPGAVESTLKGSDQTSGQTFNDVGRINDHGVVRSMRLDRRGKK